MAWAQERETAEKETLELINGGGEEAQVSRDGSA